LVTTGIQLGHMKMHLLNILNHLEASQKEVDLALVFFENKAVSFTSVREFLNNQRPADKKLKKAFVYKKE
jgi:hydroxymethylglutaryl-CoA reductase